MYYVISVYTIQIKKKVLKNIKKMPKARQIDFYDLVEDLRFSGPIQKGWPNFSPLNSKKTEFHCHIGYHWVACWKILSESKMEMEVYYVGSREKAPY